MFGYDDNKNSGVTLIELLIVIAIMAVLVGILSPMFFKYVNKTKKARDVYTADQIARAVSVAFIENQDANEAFKTFTGKKVKVSATHNGVTRSYDVYLIASSGQQDTNKISNCFNGGEKKFYKSKKDGSDGFYGVVNRELGLSTKEINAQIIPQYKAKREGAGVEGRPYTEVDRWRICRRAEDGTLEIWAAQANPWGGYPIYRVWPQPDDEYTK